MPKPGDVVLVTAVNGMVGQAAAMIATMFGARVFGVTRRAEPFAHRKLPCPHDRWIERGHRRRLAWRNRRPRRGHRLQHCRQSVFRRGEPGDGAWRPADLHHRLSSVPCRSTSSRSTAASTHSFGIDSLALDACACATILRELLPGFASGRLRPLPIAERACYPLERAKDAYRTVQSITRDRVVLLP